MFTLLLFVVATVSTPVINRQMVNDINAANLGWTADTYDDHWIGKFDRKNMQSLLGTILEGGPQLPIKTFTPEELAAAPESFDSRENWPQCLTMKDIRDQSDCGSCWAFGAVEAMSDRECTYNKQTNLSLSTEDMNSCCQTCGNGCNGGYPAAAWQYWVQTGLVTSKCRPYSLPSCDHHIPDSKNPCTKAYPTPPCRKECLPDSGLNWNTDKHKGTKVIAVRGEASIMAEIAQNGPVETAFSVYSDFLSYKSGIYHHGGGTMEGGHAVKFVGWGVEGGQKYWLVANSWNPNWGEVGYFRIRKGNNECGIENESWGGVPVSK